MVSILNVVDKKKTQRKLFPDWARMNYPRDFLCEAEIVSVIPP